MIELMLQAERSLAMGLVDQAERLYWQAIESDSRNAIAIVGLAKVARQRGDERTAIAFARRALAVDGENAVARRLMDELGAGRSGDAAAGGKPVSSSSTDVDRAAFPDALTEAERLEAARIEVDRMKRTDIEWPAADLEQVRGPNDR